MPELDDDKMAAIAAAMEAEEDDLDPRLLRWSRDELSDEEVEQLREDAERDPRLAEAVEALAPLASDVEAKIVDAALRARPGGPPRSSLVSRRRVVALASTMAAAAAAALVLWPGARPEPADLPTYRLEVSATKSASAYRGPREPARLRSDDEVTIVLRPELEVSSSALTARLYVASGDDVFRPVALTPQLERGAVRWQAPVGRLAPGLRDRVWILGVVGLPDALPLPSEARRLGSGRGWRAAARELWIEPEKEHPEAVEEEP